MAIRVIRAEQKQKVKQKKIRAAAYCRVSTDQDSQMTSYDNQVEMYTDRINADPEMELYEVFADAGISGTQAQKRPEFQRMMRAARKKEFDLLYVKSISRFARNTADCLHYVRELQNYGIRVIFEKESIDTDNKISEIFLTIMAAFAQEESRSISENVKKGIRDRYKNGEARWVTVYGYTKDFEVFEESERQRKLEEGNKRRHIGSADEEANAQMPKEEAVCKPGEYIIVEEEAAVVRRIFTEYEHGMKMQEIADGLNKDNIPTENGGAWDASCVHVILANEKYIGDIQLQKKLTVDHLTHRQIKNDFSVENGYYLDHHHPAIISREQFARVEKIRQMRRQNDSVQYPFGELLRCPYCQVSLNQKKLPIQHSSSCWYCPSCRGFILRSAIVEEAAMKAAKEKGVQEETLEYWWLEDMVDYISFGPHMLLPRVEKMLRAKRAKPREDRTLTVYWKDGTETTVTTGIDKDKDMPITLVSLYDAWLERNGGDDNEDNEDSCETRATC